MDRVMDILLEFSDDEIFFVQPMVAMEHALERSWTLELKYSKNFEKFSQSFYRDFALKYKRET